jgi:hypothetical protein
MAGQILKLKVLIISKIFETGFIKQNKIQKQRRHHIRMKPITSQ